jgi:hypothetical protein
LAFKSFIDFESVNFIGIENINNASFAIAKSLNYKIKLIAKAILQEGKIYHMVMPSFLPLNHPLAEVNLSLNSVYIKSDLAADTILTGHGAGGKATASAVISDISDVLRGCKNNLNNDYSKLDVVDKSLSYGCDFALPGKYIWHNDNEDIINQFRDFIKDYEVLFDKEDFIKGHKIFVFSVKNYSLIKELSAKFPQAGLFML